MLKDSLQKAAKEGGKRRGGFTLIELLISLAMIAILTGTTLKIVRVSDTNRILALNVNEVVSAMRFAQSSSLAAVFDEENSDRHICGLGFIATTSTEYLLFYTYATTNQYKNNPHICNNNSYLTYNSVPGNQRVILNQFKLKGSGVVFDAGSFGLNNELVFKVPYGEVYLNGSNSFGFKNFVIKKGTATKTITVNQSGQISF